MRIIVLYNLPRDPERLLFLKEAEEDTMRGAKDVAKVLAAQGNEVEVVNFSLPSFTRSIQHKGPPDLVVNLTESDGTVAHPDGLAPLVFEHFGIPYTGSNAEGLLLTKNKIRVKQIVRERGGATPLSVIYEARPIVRPQMPYPIVVKPAFEDGAVGITQQSVCTNYGTLQRQVLEVWEKFDQPALAESYIAGLDVTQFVWETTEGIFTLPPVCALFEKMPDGFFPMMSYEVKWYDGEGGAAKLENVEWKQESPGPLRPRQVNDITHTTRRFFRLFNLKGYARIDYRLTLDDETLYMLEINANPSVVSYDPVIRAALTNAGMDHFDLLDELIKGAHVRGEFAFSQSERLPIVEEKETVRERVGIRAPVEAAQR